MDLDPKKYTSLIEVSRSTPLLGWEVENQYSISKCPLQKNYYLEREIVPISSGTPTIGPNMVNG